MTSLTLSGYTAAGKTTHSRLLAQSLGLRHVWAAGLLLEMLGYDDVEGNESSLWFYHSTEIERKRRTGDFDERVDRELARLARGGGVVLDSRFIPWIANDSVVNVWLDSDLSSRARKCAHSLGRFPDNAAASDCALEIHLKDGRDIGRVADRFGRVYGPDPRIHHVILDVSPFASVENFGDDWRSQTQLCQAHLRAAVLWKLGDRIPAERLMNSNPPLAASVFHRTVGMMEWFGVAERIVPLKGAGPGQPPNVKL